MFFNSSDNDPYGDLRQREEYQRQKDINLAKGVGSFLSKAILYFFIYMLTYVMLTYIVMFFFNISSGVAMLISMALAFFVFKVKYVKAYPFKSFIVIIFISLLVQVAFY